MKYGVIFILLFVLDTLNAQYSEKKLTDGWVFSQAGFIEWLPAEVPGCVQTDLFKNQIIPHPFIGDNEKDLQWIADKHWTYQLNFDLEKEKIHSKNIELVFEGLDTYAKVFLNDQLILEANNAFRTWKIDVKRFLKEKNELRIEFIPTSEIERIKAAEIPYELPEGPRVFTRKAQFQYGWDWGPKYNTMGIWRVVKLIYWDDLKIEDVYIRQHLLSEEEADLTAEIELNNQSNKKNLVEIYVNNMLYSKTEIQEKSNKIKIPIVLNNPKLWWTNGLGEAYLYDFKIQIKDSKDQLIDERRIKRGLRTIELITDKDKFGESFYFKLNGKPVFMKGSNYIPQNSFQNWVSRENYEKLLTDVQKSNMNMLRIWGGGIYEDSYFYELCDEKGILVWQDFMFANGMYPGDEAFLKNVRQEAFDNVKRLRNHTSIALWCGNNEISEGWHRWGWQEGRSEAEKTEIWRNYQKIFNGVLPEVVIELTEEPYWESSPKFGRGDVRYISEGDAHDWWVWHDGHPFEDLVKKTPRFMSEFGFQSFPSEEVIRYINKDNSFSIDSEDFKIHQKHNRGFEIIRAYMERDFPVPEDSKEYAFVSQLVQAYGIGNAIEAQRRNRPYTMGTLYWQLNDCWPSVSWSSIDYFGNWKVLQYSVQKAFQDIMISFEENDGLLNIYVINDLNDSIENTLLIGVFDFDGDSLSQTFVQFSADGQESTKIGQIDLSEFKNKKDEIYVAVKFGDVYKIFVPGKPKDWKLKNIPIDLDMKNGKIFVRSSGFQKNVWFISEKSDWTGYLEEMLPGVSYLLDADSKRTNINLIKVLSLNKILNK